jgi:hypothetical protein
MFVAAADGIPHYGVRGGEGGPLRCYFLATIIVLIVAVAPSTTSTTTM